MTAPVRIRLCSPLTVETPYGVLTGHDLGSRKARTLLALLAAERGSVVTADRLAEALWPEVAPTDPAANVATLVSRTRRLLGEGVLVARGRTYTIGLDACVVDLDEAARLVDEAGDRLGAGATSLAAVAARRALAVLGTGTALPDEADAAWVVAVRREADELRRSARHLLASSATEPAEAVAVSGAAVEADPYDEQAVRDLMRAHTAHGKTPAALTAYDDLARRLRADLGTDPETGTRELHLALLRGLDPPAEGARAAGRARRPQLVGRETELGLVDDLWARAGEGSGSLVLIEGQAGNGKTRLLDAVSDLVSAGGGLVLRARCRPAERSLFLQPYVDALRPVLLATSPAELEELLAGHTEPWATFVPELSVLVAAAAEPARDPEVERRRSYDAVTHVLRGLARRRPVLLALDDLQEAGSASIDLLGYVAGRLADAGVLLAAAVRSEDAETVDRLADRATRVEIGPLPPSAVDALASAAGLSARAPEVLARTAGHALSVVECLRALATGDDGVPDTLAAAVRARVARLGDTTRVALEGAAVLAGPVAAAQLAGLLAADELATAQECEELARRGLMTRTGVCYEFVNDLVQECVHASLAPAVAAAYHRRAADLTTDRPETMARHALAAGDLERAAEGWLLAGRAALGRSAVDDAQVLFDRALEVGESPLVRTRVLLARARTHEARTSFAAALDDVDEALRLARRPVTAASRWQRCGPEGGDVPVALRLPFAELAEPLEAGLRLASGLGDRRAESDFSSRLAMLEASELRLGDALERARRNLAHCRLAASKDALVLALDGTKAVARAPGRGGRAAQRRGRAGADPAHAAGDLAAAVDRVRVVVRPRGGRRLGRRGSAGRRGGRAEQAERLLGVLRLLPRQRRVVPPARGRPARRARTGPERPRADLADRPPLVVRRGVRPPRRQPPGGRPARRGRDRRATRARGDRVPTWPRPGGCGAWPRSRPPRATPVSVRRRPGWSSRSTRPRGARGSPARTPTCSPRGPGADTDPARAARLLEPLVDATRESWAALHSRRRDELAQISSATS